MLQCVQRGLELGNRRSGGLKSDFADRGGGDAKVTDWPLAPAPREDRALARLGLAAPERGAYQCPRRREEEESQARKAKRGKLRRRR